MSCVKQIKGYSKRIFCNQSSLEMTSISFYLSLPSPAPIKSLCQNTRKECEALHQVAAEHTPLAQGYFLELELLNGNEYVSSALWLRKEIRTTKSCSSLLYVQENSHPCAEMKPSKQKTHDRNDTANFHQRKTAEIYVESLTSYRGIMWNESDEGLACTHSLSWLALEDCNQTLLP